MREKIKFPLAKLLKEKGFDKECEFFYSKHGSLVSYFDGKYDWNSLDVDEGMIALKTAFSESDEYVNCECSAPTIADVVMWLCEKHGIWIYTYFLGMGYSCYVIQKLQKTNPTQPVVELVKDSITYDELFNSLTEAYESAFEFLLNNLIKTETND